MKSIREAREGEPCYYDVSILGDVMEDNHFRTILSYLRSQNVFITNVDTHITDEDKMHGSITYRFRGVKMPEPMLNLPINKGSSTKMPDYHGEYLEIQGNRDAIEALQILGGRR